MYFALDTMLNAGTISLMFIALAPAISKGFVIVKYGLCFGFHI